MYFSFLTDWKLLALCLTTPAIVTLDTCFHVYFIKHSAAFVAEPLGSQHTFKRVQRPEIPCGRSESKLILIYNIGTFILSMNQSKVYQIHLDKMRSTFIVGFVCYYKYMSHTKLWCDDDLWIQYYTNEPKATKTRAVVFLAPLSNIINLMLW